MYKTILCPLAILMLSVSPPALAQEVTVADTFATKAPSSDLDTIVARVKAAYGGRKLENLKSVRIQTERGLAWPGQGQTADFVEFVTDKFDVQIDLANRRGSQERWIEQNGNIYSTRSVSAPDGGIASINYSTGTYEVNEKATFNQRFGVEMTTSDTLIAYIMITDPHNMVLEDPIYYLGKWHDRIAFSAAPEAPAFTTYIERDTGLIARTKIDLRSGTWNTVFSDYQTSRGLTYARKRMDYRDDRMVQTYTNRRHTFNKVRWSNLEIEDDLTVPPEKVDMSDMTVDEVSASVHFVGQEDYSAFIDAGDYIIATNPYGGLKDRFEAYRKDRGHQKPLRYVLSTHHHGDHLSGVSEATELGATIVATPMTIKTLEADDEHKAAKLQTLKARDQIGPVQTYIVPTSHVAEYAIIYIPDGKVIYEDDHFTNPNVGMPSYVNQSDLVFQDRVEELGLDVDIVLSGHSRKIEKWENFEAVAAKHTLGDICPRNREICREFVE